MIENIPTYPDLSDGDIIDVVFTSPMRDGAGEPVTSATGEYRCFGRLPYVTNVKCSANPFGAAFELWKGNVGSVSLKKPVLAVRAEREAKAMGALVYDWLPETTEEVLEQLETLAILIHRETDTSIFGRKNQLIRQFDRAADVVDLAKSKRNYMLLKVVIGSDFHPFETRDDRVYRNNTVRPLPSDFRMTAADRKNRARRAEEAFRIFGEAERETRMLASKLKRAGYHVRRPHPNAQALLVRIGPDRKQVDFEFTPGRNGLWSMRAAPAENKTKAARIARVIKAGMHLRLEEVFHNILGDGVLAPLNAADRGARIQPKQQLSFLENQWNADDIDKPSRDASPCPGE